MNRSKAMINVLISVAIQWIDSQIVGVHIQTEMIFDADSLALRTCSWGSDLTLHTVILVNMGEINGLDRKLSSLALGYKVTSLANTNNADLFPSQGGDIWKNTLSPLCTGLPLLRVKFTADYQQNASARTDDARRILKKDSESA